MMEIITKLINELTGIDFWIATSALMIVLARWWYLSKTKKAEQKIAKRQISFTVVMTVIAVLAIAVHRLFFSPDYTFPKDVAGILVLRIEGDDEKNSLQRDLVSTLNTDLSKEAPGQKIEVRAHTETVTEAMGLSQAHKKARKVGKDCKALLVIWGIRVSEKKFHPRLTVIEERPRIGINGDRALTVQNISELRLPAELVDEPVFLTHFVTGYDFYYRKDYASALPQFEVALKRPVADSTELNNIRFFAGNCHCLLAIGQREMERHLQQAIDYYEAAANFYVERDSSADWAKTQNNLGTAYVELTTGDRSENLKKAIAAFGAALSVRSKNAFPSDWAMIQNNLGTAYADLLTGDRSENLKRAIAAYNAALSIYNEKDYPMDWAMTQNNLVYRFIKNFTIKFKIRILPLNH